MKKIGLCAFSIFNALCMAPATGAQQKIKQEQPTRHEKSEPEYFKIAAPILVTASQTMEAIKTEGWNPNTFTQIQWFERGILLKYLVQHVEELYIADQLKPYDERIKAADDQISTLKRSRKNNKIIAELKQQKSKLEQERADAKTNIGIFASSAGKFIEATISQAIGDQLATLAPHDYADVMKTAFTSGLRLWILSDVSSSIAASILQEIIKQTKPASLKWDWYPYAPLGSTHTTAIYCGPKDPYCLHGAKQIDVNETLHLIGDELSSTVKGVSLPLISIVTGYMSHVIGSAVGNLPKTLGKFINAFADATQTPWLINFLQQAQPTARILEPLLKAAQRYADHYIPIMSLRILYSMFDDLNVHMTDQQKQEFRKYYITAAKAHGLQGASGEMVKFVANLQAAA
jgi:hypothetical protein